MKPRTKNLLLGLLLFVGVAVAAQEATILLAPRVLMWTAMRRLEHIAHGVNRISHGPRIDERRHEIVMPNPDFLFSDCIYDLGEGPLRVSAEIPQGTYWSLSAYSERTDNFYIVNDRTADSTRIALVLAAEGQPLPPSAAGLPVVRSPSRRGVLLFRTLINDEAHFAEIDRVRRSAQCYTMK
jgi:uncharacterized membrane protein